VNFVKTVNKVPSETHEPLPPGPLPVPALRTSDTRESTIASYPHAPPGAPSRGMGVEIDCSLHSMLVVIGGPIGGALQELDVTIERAASDVRGVAQSDHR
jgi:hypothetical protein